MRSQNPSFDWNALRPEWLWVYDGMVPVADTWSQWLSVPTSVFLVREGRVEIEADGGVQTIAAGAAFLAGEGMRRQWFEAGTRLLSVGFQAHWPDGRRLLGDGLNRRVNPDEAAPIAAATRNLYRAIHGRRAEVTFVEAAEKRMLSLSEWARQEAAFRVWFAAYLEFLLRLGIEPVVPRQPADARVRELLQRLDAWPLDRPLDLRRLGSALGPRRIEQLLTRFIGATPHAYYHQRRLEAARTLLRSSNRPLKQLAAELGFRHASHFTKWFRQQTGQPPSEYRQSQAWPRQAIL